MTYYTFLDTPAGTMLLMGDGKTVTGAHWKIFRRAPKVGEDWVEDRAVFAGLIQQLEEYFAGQRSTFELEYELQGTDFQMDVWRELEKIPFGTRSSYQSIATAIGRPGAVRAVGTAVGSNPISIVVPCHRVLASSGKLGGYAGGLDNKEMLLGIEKIAWVGVPKK